MTLNQRTETLNYSDLYRQQLATAQLESERLGFTRPSRISPDVRISDDLLGASSKLTSALSGYFDRMLPGYWGNSCQTLSTNMFAHLNARDIPADIVLGNVLVNGTDEFEATLEGLQAEVRAQQPLEGVQNVHGCAVRGGRWSRTTH